MPVKFYYNTDQQCYKKEIIIRSVVDSAHSILDLPEIIEVCLYALNRSINGGIDHTRSNRLAINIDLALTDIPTVLLHELIHINQRHTGKLSITPEGVYHWNGVAYSNTNPDSISKNEYFSLPWELDVSRRLPGLMRELVGQKLSIT